MKMEAWIIKREHLSSLRVTISHVENLRDTWRTISSIFEGNHFTCWEFKRHVEIFLEEEHGLRDSPEEKEKLETGHLIKKNSKEKILEKNKKEFKDKTIFITILRNNFLLF